MLRAQLDVKGLKDSDFAQTIDIESIAQRAPSQVQQLCQKWRVPKEIGQDIVKLALYDIILYIGEGVHGQSCFYTMAGLTGNRQ